MCYYEQTMLASRGILFTPPHWNMQTTSLDQDREHGSLGLISDM